MWLWLLIVLFFLNGDSCLSAPTSLGPTSDQEARLLWLAGKTSSEKSRYQEAINDLERLVARYPGHKNYTAAHFLLGKSYFELGNYSKAVAPLKYFISASDPSIASIPGRLLLARTYLHTGQNHEAFLLSEEAIRLFSRGNRNKEQALELEATIVKVHALMQLKNTQEAEDLLERLSQRLKKNPFPHLEAEADLLRLESKIQFCSELPTKQPADELQAKSQFERRGLCLLEALIHLHEILSLKQDQFLHPAVAKIRSAFMSYRTSSLQPSGSSYIQDSKHKRTVTELKQYKLELASALFEIYRKNTKTGIDLLGSWAMKSSDLQKREIVELSHQLENSTTEPSWPQK